MNTYELFNMDCIELNELIDKTKVALRDKNIWYKNLHDEIVDIKENYPNLQLFFEDDGDISLSKNGCKMLQKLINLELEIRNFEEQEIFFLGGKEAYFYFKNTRILKEWIKKFKQRAENF